MRFSNLHRILELLDECEPISIVEFGSGLSTVMVAAWLRERGRGTLLSIDHDVSWGAKTQSLLVRCNLADFARVVVAPLAQYSQGHDWYDTSAITFSMDRVDFVVVDGPPAGLAHLQRARWPALDFLYERLSPAAVIVLDDAKRAGEKSVVASWMEAHPEFSFALGITSSGLAVLRRGGTEAMTPAHEVACGGTNGQNRRNSLAQ